MTLREQMLNHLTKAEALDQEIDRIEAVVDSRITTPHEEIRLYQAKQVLGDNKIYQNRVSRRNYHLNWAQVYGIVISALKETNDQAPG